MQVPHQTLCVSSGLFDIGKCSCGIAIPPNVAVAPWAA